MLNDFHVHSTESDGQLSPEELLDLASANGVGVIALCDHDTTAGVERFVRYGRERGIKALSGIELSAQWKRGNCHILGLGVSHDHEPLEAVLKKTRESRDLRNELILEKLRDLGIRISTEQLRQEAGGEVVARPHIAAALYKAGHVSSKQEAFDKYLTRGGLAYVDRFRLAPGEGIGLLREAGAFVVLAHPSQLNLSNTDLFEFVADLKKFGLQGVEVYSPHTTDEQIELYRKISVSLGLTPTGGSDFHALVEGERVPGFYKAATPIPELHIPQLDV
ncbi:MAG: PHP domain-containing protein [Chitinispirillaceae bacterium]